jgi:hypothetical protein
MKGRSMIRTALLALAGTALAGCAATGAPAEDPVAALTEECAARGGVLMPIPGAHHGNERANWSCDIRGGGRLVRP